MAIEDPSTGWAFVIDPTTGMLLEEQQLETYSDGDFPLGAVTYAMTFGPASIVNSLGTRPAGYTGTAGTPHKPAHEHDGTAGDLHSRAGCTHPVHRSCRTAFEHALDRNVEVTGDLTLQEIEVANADEQLMRQGLSGEGASDRWNERTRIRHGLRPERGGSDGRAHRPIRPTCPLGCG